MGDDSFGVKPAERHLIYETLSHYGLGPQQFIAINVRMAQNYAAGVKNKLMILANLYDRLAKKTGLPLLFIPISLDQAEGEQVTAIKLSELMQTHFAILEDPNLTPALVKGVLSQAWGAVGVSYHFCTFTLSEGVPAICIYTGDYYNQKGRGLAEFWGDDRLALSLENLDTDQAAKAILDLFDDDYFRSSLVMKSAQLVDHWCEVFNRAHTMVFGRPKKAAVQL